MLEYKSGPSVCNGTKDFRDRMFISVLEGPEGMYLVAEKNRNIELLILHTIQIVAQISFFSDDIILSSTASQSCFGIDGFRLPLLKNKTFCIKLQSGTSLFCIGNHKTENPPVYFNVIEPFRPVFTVL